MRRLLTVGILSALLFSATRAEASCTVWLFQAANYYWKQCVDDKGIQHCYKAKDEKGTNAQEVSCAK